MGESSASRRLVWNGGGAMEMCSERQVTNPWEMRLELSERPCRVAGMFRQQVEAGTAGWWSPGGADRKLPQCSP